MDVSRSTGARVGAPLPALEVAPERYLVGAEVLPMRGPARDHEVDPGATRLAAALGVVAAKAPGRDVILLRRRARHGRRGRGRGPRAAAAGGRLFTAPSQPPPLDAGFLRARARREGAEVVVEATVASATRGTAVVRLSQSGRPDVARAPLTLVPGGQERVLLVDDAPLAAPYTLVLELAAGTPDDDPGNDRLVVAPRRPADGGPRGRPGGAGSPPAGLVVRVAATPRPEASGWCRRAWSSPTCPRPCSSRTALRCSGMWRGGGRIVFLGGPDAGRAGGWSGSDVERTLSPFVVRRAPDTRRAWLVALDRSASMAEGALVHVRDALRAFLRALPTDERVAVLPFSGVPDAQLLAPGFVQGGDVAARETLEASLDALVARGYRPARGRRGCRRSRRGGVGRRADRARPG
ncbi:MAG: hypothetical protein R3F05_10200 [Planctomycetota bacterium]